MGVLRSHYPKYEESATHIPDLDGFQIGLRRSVRLCLKATAQKQRRDTNGVKSKRANNPTTHLHAYGECPCSNTAILSQETRAKTSEILCLPHFRHCRPKPIGRHRRVSTHHFRRHLGPWPANPPVKEVQPRDQARYVKDLHLPTPLLCKNNNTEGGSSTAYSLSPTRVGAS
jgi:hypothetical protein